MTRSELITSLSARFPDLPRSDVETAVKEILAAMSAALARGERIELRGFGSFDINYRPPRIGRNPKTGVQVEVPAKCVPAFKPGKELRARVDLQPVELRKAA